MGTTRFNQCACRRVWAAILTASALTVSIPTAVPAWGGAFENLSFEIEDTQNGRVPGWTTSPGGIDFNIVQIFGGGFSLLDSSFRETHFGRSQPAPIIGMYSLGVWPPNDGIHPAILYQRVDIPSDAQSLQFLYEGTDLRVTLDGVAQPLFRLGDRPTGNSTVPRANYWAVDVSQYAGTTRSLSFEFRSFGNSGDLHVENQPGLPNAWMHVIDDLQFSPVSAVPEPSTWALVGAGCLLAGASSLGGRGRKGWDSGNSCESSAVDVRGRR